jgi:hypothetical protein
LRLPAGCPHNAPRGLTPWLLFAPNEVGFAMQKPNRP